MKKCKHTKLYAVRKSNEYEPIKEKFTLVQITKANRWIKGVAILFHTLSLSSVLDGGVDGQRHVPATLRPGKRPANHFTVICVGPRSGRNGCGKSHPPLEFDPRTIQPVASRDTEYAIPSHNIGYKQQQRIGEYISVFNQYNSNYTSENNIFF